MILKRYGSSYHSVVPNFNPAAMTEIGFRRDQVFSVSVDDFETRYQKASQSDLVAEADAVVQRDAERAVLEDLERALERAVEGLGDGEVVVILNDKDDHPKTRERRESTIVEGENRFHFHWWVDPPLKVAVYHTS